MSEVQPVSDAPVSRLTSRLRTTRLVLSLGAIGLAVFIVGLGVCAVYVLPRLADKEWSVEGYVLAASCNSPASSFLQETPRPGEGAMGGVLLEGAEVRQYYWLEEGTPLSSWFDVTSTDANGRFRIDAFTNPWGWNIGLEARKLGFEVAYLTYDLRSPSERVFVARLRPLDCQ